MKRPDDALVAYRNALKEHFRDWTVFRIVAIYEKQAQYEKAIAEIDALVKTNAKDPEAYQIRGRLQARAKHMDAA
ncbi:tetratricopeptide repeat protein, partial [Acinetobacter baumannii]